MAVDNVKELSLLDITEKILKESAEPISIYELIERAATEKGLDTSNVDRMTQLYMDITLSGRFVFVGDDKWALKLMNDNLEYWDKDGYAFVTPEETDETDDEELDFTAFNLDDIEEEVEAEEDEDDEELDEEIIEEKEYIDVGLQIESIDEDDAIEDVDLDLDEDDDYDEDDYNDIMDDYEDMYDK